MALIRIKRVYEDPNKEDGYRVLVDRLWPRGLKKEDAHIDEWLKEAAPSAELRKWFDHDPDRWTEFKKRYILELKENAVLENFIDRLSENKTITLLYAAHDEKHNHALVLQNFICNTN